MKMLSIIVPMYNVEPYVERCIRSLEDQDIEKDDYEIICINDGSPDRSKDIVIELKKKFDNIILIDQENQGVSMARNNGIDRATGKYLLMIDPDDYVKKNSFASIIRYSEEKSAQVSFLGYTFLNADESVKKTIDFSDLSGTVFTGLEAYYKVRRERNTDPDRMVAILFDKEFLNTHHLRYLPNVPYLEDGELIPRILTLAEKCVFDRCLFYQRTTRSGSATNSDLARSKRANKGFIKAASNLKSFQQNAHLSETQIIFINQPVAKFVLLATISNISLLSIRIFFKAYSELVSLGFKKLDVEGCDNIYSRFGLIYNKSATYFFVYWMARKFFIAVEKKLRLKGVFLLDRLFLIFNLYERFIIRSEKHPIKEF